MGNVCRWLAEQAEGMGVEIYPGFTASEILFDDEGAVKGIATGEMGVGADGQQRIVMYPAWNCMRDIRYSQRGAVGTSGSN
ncbi:MAG: hypothetical protein CM15mP84_07490 [Cellvibrionales bacterium]|nr:MAG: hypothetical protein CM15mP84_07490 [Cellvibrionales bacterium]